MSNGEQAKSVQLNADASEFTLSFDAAEFKPSSMDSDVALNAGAAEFSLDAGAAEFTPGSFAAAVAGGKPQENTDNVTKSVEKPVTADSPSSSSQSLSCGSNDSIEDRIISPSMSPDTSVRPAAAPREHDSSDPAKKRLEMVDSISAAGTGSSEGHSQQPQVEESAEKPRSRASSITERLKQGGKKAVRYTKDLFAAIKLLKREPLPENLKLPPALDPSADQAALKRANSNHGGRKGFGRRKQDRWQPRKPPSGDDEKLQQAANALLNKISPLNFDKLSAQILELPIKTADQLLLVVQQVHYKAMTFAAYAHVYADLCLKLSSELPDIEDKVEGEEGAEDAGEVRSFKPILLNTCQAEFNRDRTDEIKKIEEIQDEDDRMDAENKRRRKMLGNVQFIGALFNRSLLPASILHTCIQELLKDQDGKEDQTVMEDRLDSLCDILRSSGQALDEGSENNRKKLEGYLSKVQEMSQDKALPSRIRYAFMEIIDLKEDGWKSRKAMREEKHEKDAAAMAVPSPKPKKGGRDGDGKGRDRGDRDRHDRGDKGDRERRGRNRDRDDRRGGRGERGERGDRRRNDRRPARVETNSTDADGWVMSGSAKTTKRGNFGAFTRGNTPRGGNATVTPPSRAAPKPAPKAVKHSYGSAGGFAALAGSSSESESDDDEDKEEATIGSEAEDQEEAASSDGEDTKNDFAGKSAREIVGDAAFDKLEMRVQNICNELMSNHIEQEAKECMQEVVESIDEKQRAGVIPELVFTLLGTALDTSDTKTTERLLCNNLIAASVQDSLLSKEQLVNGLLFTADMLDDLLIDMPKAADYFAHSVKLLLDKELLEDEDLEKVTGAMTPKVADKFRAAL